MRFLAIDDVVFSQGNSNGGPRVSVAGQGSPPVRRNPCRACSSTGAADRGLQAAIDAAMRIQTGGADVVVAGVVVTADNASQQNDAGAVCLIVAEDKLVELGLGSMAWPHSWAATGCDPSRMGICPVPAVAKLFARSGVNWSDIDLVELNEAFSPQVLACLKGWGWGDRDKINVNGSGI